MLGIFFIFMSFCLTASISGNSLSTTSAFRKLFYPEGSMSMFFALSAAVITTYSTSIIFNSANRKIKISDAFIGTISGGIIFGPVASYATSLAVPIALGFSAGLVTSFYRSVVMPRINHLLIYDTMGLFGGILFNSILGTVVAAPVVCIAFVNFSLPSPAWNATDRITNYAEAGFLLVYVGVSAGIGLFGGLTASFFMRCS